MCLGIAGQVIDLIPGSDLARVSVFGMERTINVGLLEKDLLAPGSWVLIHVGFAITAMDDAEAKNSMALLRAIGGGEIENELPADFERAKSAPSRRESRMK